MTLLSYRVGSRAFLIIMAYILCVGAAVGVKLYLEHLDTDRLQASAGAETDRLEVIYNPDWFSKAQFSKDAPTSIWTIANKKHSITPIDYQPAKLVSIQGMQVDAKIAET